MRRLIVASLLLASCDPPQFSEDSRVAIRRVLDEQRDAWNRGEIEAFMVGYHNSPKTIFTSGAKVRRGWDETLRRYRERYSAGNKMGRLDFTDVEVRGLGPDAAVVLGRYELTQTPEASRGVFTLVFERTAGTWAIVHDHTSAEDTP